MTEGVHPQASLDPADWSELRALGHRMLDDLFNELEGIRQEPVWQPMPDSVRGAWDQPMQHAGLPMAEVYDEYRRLLAPYVVGNRHPQFSAGCMRWHRGRRTGRNAGRWTECELWRP